MRMSAATEKHGFLPNFCDIRLVFAWVLTAELLALVLTLAVGVSDFWQHLSLRSLYLQWVGLMLAGLLCLLGPRFNRLGHRAAGVLAWLLALLVTSGVHLFSQRLMQGTWRPDWGVLAAHLGIAAILGAVVLRYLYELHCHQARELAEARARAQALQARIRPHFLFNSMNTVASLTHQDADLAESVIHDLSDLFRASLADADQPTTLAQELALARGYLRIEQQRLGDRLRVCWDLADLPEQARVPPLFIQPLLENAVYHGIEPAVAGGEIVIAGRFRKGLVNLSISNPLPPRSGSGRQGNRMAQQNVAERLQAFFGESAGMRIGEVEGRYQVRVYFPASEAGAT
jgi:two-component system sensor histidine kinase AlgZ